MFRKHEVPVMDADQVTSMNTHPVCQVVEERRQSSVLMFNVVLAHVYALCARSYGFESFSIRDT